MPSACRFPPPWTIEEHTESFIVKDATGQALGYFYFGRATILFSFSGAHTLSLSNTSHVRPIHPGTP
jgi:hypothetical protein